MIQHGRLLLERYGQDRSAADPFPSWSVAKSITHALVGLLVKDGKLDIHAPALVPEWQAPGDPRRMADHVDMAVEVHARSGGTALPPRDDIDARVALGVSRCARRTNILDREPAGM